MLFEDHPASATLYTPKEDMARKNRREKLTSETKMAGAKGMTAKEARVAVKMMVGASTKTALSENGAIQFSFVKIFSMSAMTCRAPKGPARLGPYLSWRNPRTLRSTQIVPAAMRSTPRSTPPMRKMAVTRTLIARLLARRARGMPRREGRYR